MWRYAAIRAEHARSSTSQASFPVYDSTLRLSGRSPRTQQPHGPSVASECTFAVLWPRLLTSRLCRVPAVQTFLPVPMEQTWGRSSERQGSLPCFDSPARSQTRLRLRVPMEPPLKPLRGREALRHHWQIISGIALAPPLFHPLIWGSGTSVASPVAR